MTKILDLGGQPEIWDSIDSPLQITCLNLPGIARKSAQTHHHIRFVEGDACKMPEFAPGDFDIVFSNSVIEHVGDVDKRRAFASEVLRLQADYWIQTPSKHFPVEAHCGMPFWWFYPKSVRAYLISRWERKLPGWTRMVKTTTVVSAHELRELFPGCKLVREWIVFPKSLIVYSSSRV